jgi:5-methyltetrahydrofolate--homocysteine methyltransferase
MPIRRALHLSGLEPLVIDSDALFVNVGERTNVTGSAQFRKLIMEDALRRLPSRSPASRSNGAQVLDVNMDEGMLDAERRW